MDAATGRPPVPNKKLSARETEIKNTEIKNLEMEPVTL